MKTWTKVAIPIAAVAVLVAWYAFRPERLVINRRVDEAMPNAPGVLAAQPRESGRFYGILPRPKVSLLSTRWEMGRMFFA
jgi:hypothetical protein